jgi:calmodulin
MFEPKNIRMRAELIQQTDLSAEALLDGLTTEQFEDKLRTLFKSYDVDGSGSIDFDEFISCMEALDLKLSHTEMVTLMDAADEDHSGNLQFEEFVNFFTNNLLNLEREKHLRLLQSSIHELAAGNSEGDESDDVMKNEALKIFSTEITALFKMFDHNHTGIISYNDFQSVLSSVSMKFSSYLVDILKAEIHADANGMVDYASTINTCAELGKDII